MRDPLRSFIAKCEQLWPGSKTTPTIVTQENEMPKFDDTKSLFPEEDRKNESGPDFTGEIDIGGTKYRLAGWKRVSKKTGKKFLSGEVQPKNGSNKGKTKPDFDDPLEGF